MISNPTPPPLTPYSVGLMDGSNGKTNSELWGRLAHTRSDLAERDSWPGVGLKLALVISDLVHLICTLI